MLYRQSEACRMLKAALTPTQYRVVQALCNGGGTDRDIGSLLGLAHTTVRDHLRDVRRKIGAKTRAEIVIYCSEDKAARLASAEHAVAEQPRQLSELCQIVCGLVNELRKLEWLIRKDASRARITQRQRKPGPEGASITALRSRRA